MAIKILTATFLVLADARLDPQVKNAENIITLSEYPFAQEAANVIFEKFSVIVSLIEAQAATEILKEKAEALGITTEKTEALGITTCGVKAFADDVRQLVEGLLSGEDPSIEKFQYKYQALDAEAKQYFELFAQEAASANDNASKTIEKRQAEFQANVATLIATLGEYASPDAANVEKFLQAREGVIKAALLQFFDEEAMGNPAELYGHTLAQYQVAATAIKDATVSWLKDRKADVGLRGDAENCLQSIDLSSGDGQLHPARDAFSDAFNSAVAEE